jgi:hypothetical protein
VMPPDARSGPEGPPRSQTPPPSRSTQIIAQQQRQARARVEALERRLRISRWAHREMPLTVHYGPRPLLTAPLAELLGRRAA